MDCGNLDDNSIFLLNKDTKAFQKEELYRATRAKIRARLSWWLNEGDCTSKFFFDKVKWKMVRENIESVHDAHGNLIVS